MLAKEENDRLCRVEGDAPMGRMLRELYWIPAANSEKIIAGGKPVRCRLIGRDYVLFRTHKGIVGCFDERCPHRGVSLALARSEDEALRCIYHGWKFGVNGKVLEVPTLNERQEEFCQKVHFNHHAVREAAGMVWVYVGSAKTPPPFPAFEFTALPPEQCVPFKQTLPFNWVQDLEGTMDSSHLSMLHSSYFVTLALQGGQALLMKHDKSPRYEVEKQPYGYRYAAFRDLPDGREYARINNFALPWYAFICPGDAPDGDRTAIFGVPIDDTHTMHWMVRYNPHKPVTSQYLTHFSDPDNWPPLPPGGPEDNWGQDRYLMEKKGHWSGFKAIATEDFAVGVSQGAIADRSLEQLCATDIAVVHLRRLLLDAVGEFAAGKVPTLANHAAIDYPGIRPVVDTLRAGQDWHELKV